MEQLEKRLEQYAPLWGRFTPAARLYRSSRCSVYALSSGGPEEDVSYVAKVITILGQGENLERRAAEVRQEIAALEQLRDCATVVTLYDTAWMPLYDHDALVGWDVLLRMERLDCVAELLREGETLTISEVRTLAWDIAAALAAAHQLGVIHRDVKPANLYRTAHGRFQLGDFGIARHCRTGIMETMTGTAAYMAPEVARGDVYDSRVDLYSLGIVLYQLLNGGQLPLTDEHTSFAQRETAVRRRWQLNRLPPPPQGDRRLKRIVLRCCASQAQKRFPSAEALLRALEPQHRGWQIAAVAGWTCALLAAAAALALPRQEVIVQLPDAPPVQSELVEDSRPEPTEEPAEEETQTVQRRYAVIKGVMTWEEARTYCESQGGQLATIENQEQMDTITALLEENQVKTVWLGATNFSEGDDFQWLTGEPVQFAAWAIGEPNNESGEEHYLMMYQKGEEGWVWNDTVRNGMTSFEQTSCGFVCQWDE